MTDTSTAAVPAASTDPAASTVPGVSSDSTTSTVPATSTTTVHLGDNQYGKAEVRLVRVTRDTPRHEIEDLTITTQLRGTALADSYTDGDNAKVVATDTQKNVVYAFAREHGVHSPEEFLLRVGRHFTTAFDWYDGATLSAEQHAWERIAVDGHEHDHAFVRAGRGTRTAVVQIDGDSTHVIAGVTDLTVLKSTGSEFHGFPRDGYTTLAETDDRILATSVTARWRYTPEAVAAGIDYDERYTAILDRMLATFADLHSLALQQTLFAMGRTAIEAFPEIAEVRFAMPNKHHFLVDLTPFGLDNPGEVFYAADRPYGLIAGTVVRDGVADAPAAWRSLPGFV
ncbi:factor-independent urate hydroxylase [Curtobacterium sp. ISL-83]|uniref:factor-independent urate hydroxylase n=1 Tax=Curtobacterium sp. ISL-83 TaxID=2819145 RepID=UPI001BE4E473|nr:urate oxidase [Curtobacterium sp. ISL-83]MBT2501252.1 urate oxidase [Curtobacterium sp. ISL-83]